MKKISIIIIAVVGFTFASCNDWLDVNPTTELDRSELFQSENGYSEALTGVYSNMTKLSLYGRNLTWYMLDEMAGCYNSTGWGTNYSIALYPYKHSNPKRTDLIISMVDSVWTGADITIW